MILVTGANGFVARYVIAELLQGGHEIAMTGRADRGTESFGDRRIPYEPVDIRVKSDFDALDKYRIHTIVHCAAALMIDNRPHVDYFMINALGTFNILEWARRNGVEKFIYAQTHSDMNAYPGILLPDDANPYFKPADFDRANSLPFITSKIAAAQMARCYIERGIFDGCILRIANIRGVGSRDEKHDCVFHQFIQKAIKGEPLELWGERKTVRDLIYVKDVARAIRKAAETTPWPCSPVFNIGSGIGLTIEEEAVAIVEIFSDPQRRSPIVLRPDIPEVRKHSLIFDIRKAKSMLGWEPEYSYKEGLEDMKKIMREI